MCCLISLRFDTWNGTDCTLDGDVYWCQILQNHGIIFGYPTVCQYVSWCYHQEHSILCQRLICVLSPWGAFIDWFSLILTIGWAACHIMSNCMKCTAGGSTSSASVRGVSRGSDLPETRTGAWNLAYDNSLLTLALVIFWQARSNNAAVWDEFWS